jgi:hypothetical protein
VSLNAGVPNTGVAGHSIVSSGGQLSTTGAVVSATVMVWLHWALFSQSSCARHVRVTLKLPPHRPLVTVLTTLTLTLGSHTSLAVGGPKPHSLPHSTVRSGAQVMLGAVVSATVMVWLHWAAFSQSSAARQVRVTLKLPPHWTFVTVLTTLMLTLRSQASLAVGAPKSHSSPHSTVRFGAQVMVGAVVSATVTVWLH